MAELVRMNLQMFAGEGAPAGGDTGAAAVTGTEAQAATEGGQGATSEEEAARREAFEAAIRDNKDLYEEKLKSQLDRRMRKSASDIEALKGANARYENLAQSLANRYGVDPTDLDGIAKAVDSDSSWLEEMAARNGLTVEQQRHMNALEAENQRFKAAREAADRQQRADETLGRWRQEAEELKATFPDFDLEAEVNGNPDFADLLGKGVPMRTAYQVVHMDDIMTSGMQYAVQRTKDSVAASVRANGLRPREGAGRSNAPTRITTDVNKLTKEQREEYKRRAARGEEITFG